MTSLPAPTPQEAGQLTVRDILERALAARPDHEALVGRGSRLTYRELDDAANRAANALLDLGVRGGDPVAVSLPNDVTAAVTLLAAARIGAVWVGVNRQLAASEKAYIVADSGAVVLIGEERSVAALTTSQFHLSTLRHVLRTDDDQTRSEWAELTKSAAADRPNAEVRPLDPAALGYTSGTTGFPKGVVLSHRSLIMQGAVFTSTRSITSEARYGVWLPLCNVQALMMSMLTMAQVGGTTVIIDRSDAATIARWIEQEGITHIPSVATVLNDLLSPSFVDPSSLCSLRDVTAGGADVPPALVARFFATTGVHPSVGYGQTEAAGAISMTDVGTPSVPGSVGRPLPHLEIAIVDESGPVAPGETGELLVRAVRHGQWAGLFEPMTEYWRQPEATKETLREGWLRTGDLCALGAGGELYVRGRKTQMILRGGANVYPAEVERVLLDEPGVDAAVVLGLPDERLGERIVAVVATTPGLSVTSQACLDRCQDHLARYKRPDRIVVVSDLPRNASGKVSRVEARRIFLEAEIAPAE